MTALRRLARPALLVCPLCAGTLFLGRCALWCQRCRWTVSA